MVEGKQHKCVLFPRGLFVFRNLLMLYLIFLFCFRLLTFLKNGGIGRKKGEKDQEGEHKTSTYGKRFVALGGTDR